MKKLIICLFVTLALFVSLFACSNPMGERNYKDIPLGVIPCDCATSEPVDVVADGRIPDAFTVSNLADVSDQGGLGSCVAHGTTTAVSQMIGVDRISSHWVMMAIDACNGAQCADGLSFLDGQWSSGLVDKSTCPYVDQCNACGDTTKTIFPSGDLTYQAITCDLTNISNALYNTGNALVICMYLYTDFYDSSCTYCYDGLGTYLGGHCMGGVGYDLNKCSGAVYIENSWGTGWGCNGFLWATNNALLRGYAKGRNVFPNEAFQIGS